MKNLNFLLLLFIPILSFGQDRTSDSLALVQLYTDLNGENWTKGENWLSDSPLDDWEGITMSNDRVLHIKLHQFGIDGSFPMSITELSELSSFDVRGGIMNGSLPSELINLTKLSFLSISQCGVSGPLPDNFSDFPLLRTCILTFNNISGSLPLSLPNSLTYINWKGNQLSGEIPAAWEGKDMTWIDLGNNELEGSIDILSTMPTLGTIDMSNNNWDEAPFPEWVDDLPNLSWFACESCNLVGDLPPSLDFSDRLSHDRVLINDNQLSGDISLLFSSPDSPRGIYLRARNNNFSGTFPAHKLLTANQVDVRGNNYSSITEFNENITFNTFDIFDNDFTFSSLDPIKYYIQVDTIIGVKYDKQSDLLTSDTIMVTEPTSLTIEAGDDYPGTMYEWYKDGAVVTDEVGSALTVVVDQNSNDARYRCKMTHADYPELTLWRNYLTVEVDISTSTVEEAIGRIITVSPNPAINRLYMKFDSDTDVQKLEYTIFSMEGNRLQTGLVTDQNSIDISLLSQGSYYLNIMIDGRPQAIKFMKL